MKRILLLLFTLILLSGTYFQLSATKIPYFARQFNASCSACHVSPPKLNAFGEDFRLNSYRLPDRDKKPTMPLAVWISSRTEFTSDEEIDAIRNYINRVEVISGGTFANERFSYFLE